MHTVISLAPSLARACVLGNTSEPRRRRCGHGAEYFERDVERALRPSAGYLRDLTAVKDVGLLQ